MPPNRTFDPPPREANPAPPAPAGSREVLPPPEPRAARCQAAVGLALVGVATLLALLADYALAGGPAILSTARLVLVAAGSLVAGHALSRRADLPSVWALAAVAGYLAGLVAVPAHWDSLRLVLWVGAAIATVGAAFSAMPAHVRYPSIACLTLVHFAGILTATTWPEPTPYVTAQVGNRFYLPYLQFAYLRNAYHFYSPEPGPANLMLALITYDLDAPDPKTGSKSESTWEVLPNRASHTRDPLAVSYYRRLSITEYAARYVPDSGVRTDERINIDKRRLDVAQGLFGHGKAIPHPPDDYEPRIRWYMHPTPETSRYILPSYARHLSAEFARPGRRVSNIKLYTVEHRVVSAIFFVKMDCDPYHPSLYRARFLGDFGPDGALKDPLDPMLYWLIPVTQKRPDASYQDWKPEHLNDYLSQHAGHVFDWRSLRP